MHFWEQFFKRHSSSMGVPILWALFYWPLCPRGRSDRHGFSLMLDFVLFLVRAVLLSKHGLLNRFKGGFTVLSTKAISTLLTLQGIGIFSERITYPLIAVCLQKIYYYNLLTSFRFLCALVLGKYGTSTERSCALTARCAYNTTATA